MFFKPRQLQLDEIRTVKIVNRYRTETWSLENDMMYQLEITLKNGSLIKEGLSEKEALSKYPDFLKSIENYECDLKYTKQ